MAIPMPDEIGIELNKLQEPIEGVRWEEKNRYHLTLKFLGDTEAHRSEDLKAALDEISLSAFSITMQGLGYFPGSGSPRVLWAGINKNRPLQGLQQTIEDLCTELGFDPEQRSFKPHVTIGRVKDASKNKITSFVERHEDFRIYDIPVKNVVLYESKLHPDGAKHNPQKEIEMATQ